MRQGLKNGALFVGAVIGAGFATGREISQFFGSSSPFIAALSGVLLGGCCALFMCVGKSGKRLFGRFEKVFAVISFICTITVFIAMFCAAELLLYDIFAFSYGGIITALLAVITLLLGTDRFKAANSIAVVAIVAFTVIIYIAVGAPIRSGGISIVRPIAYSALNVLPAGLVMAEAGKGASRKSVAVAGISAGITFALLLFCIQNVVFNSSDSIPMLSAASTCGLRYLSAGLIFLAIYTTMLSTGDLLIADITAKLKDEYVSALVLLAFCWPISLLLSFKNVVAYGYTAVSVIGLVYLAAAVYLLVNLKLKKKRQGSLS